MRRCSSAEEPSAAASAAMRASTSATAARCACSTACDLLLEVALRAVEVVGEAPEPLLQTSLGARELVGEVLAGSTLPLDERRAPLLAEPTLLLGQDRDRRGPLARERPPHLLDVERGLLVDGTADGGARLIDEAIGVARPIPAAPEREVEHEREDERGREAGGEDPDGHSGMLVRVVPLRLGADACGQPTCQTTSVAATSTVASARSRSAASGARMSASRSSGSCAAVRAGRALPRPRRRRAADGEPAVERALCASESTVAHAAATTATGLIAPVWARNAVSTGNAPHARAKPRSVWTRPPSQLEVVRGDEERPDGDRQRAATRS